MIVLLSSTQHLDLIFCDGNNSLTIIVTVISFKDPPSAVTQQLTRLRERRRECKNNGEESKLAGGVFVMVRSIASDSAIGTDAQLQALKIRPKHRLIPKSATPFGILALFTMYSFLLASTFTILFGEILFMGGFDLYETSYCEANYTHIDYENPDYHQNPCRNERYIFLLGLTLKECDYARRILVSVLLGGIIGYERKSADRPAGIRTMSLVSLGSCFFTISSMRAFESSTMAFDAARVSAAIPSGVGFLGACLIWKGSTGKGSNEAPSVHGLTTAASVWLSASIGVNSGGKLYVVAFYTTALVIILLRLGPRLYFQDDAPDYLSHGTEDSDFSLDDNYDNDPGSEGGSESKSLHDEYDVFDSRNISKEETEYLVPVRDKSENQKRKKVDLDVSYHQ